MRAIRPSAALPELPRAGTLSTTRGQAAATLGLSLLAGLALAASPDWWLAFGLVGIAGLVACGLMNPALFLGIFLFVRPVLDEFSGATAGVPSANVAGALGVLLVGITVVALSLRRERFSVPGTAALVAIVLVSVVAALQSRFELGGAVGGDSLAEIVRLVALVAVFALAAHVSTSLDRTRTLFVVVALSAAIPALYGMVELAGGAPVKEGTDIGRISGTFTGPVPFGAFLAFAALITIFGPVKHIPGWVRWPALALMLLALTESFSRVGWVFFIVGLIVLGWPQQKRLVAAFVVGLVIVGMASSDVRERALPAGSDAPSAASSEAGYESYGWRAENWGGLLDKWAEKPLLGYGLQSTQYVNPRAPVGLVAAAGGGYEAHNMIIRVLVEGGIVLLLVYLTFFALVLRRLWRLLRADWELAGSARLLFVVWALVLFTGITTDDPFSLTAVMVGLLALTGALEGAWRVAGPEAGERANGEAGTPGAFWRPAAPGTGAG